MTSRSSETESGVQLTATGSTKSMKTSKKSRKQCIRDGKKEGKVAQANVGNPDENIEARMTKKGPRKRKMESPDESRSADCERASQNRKTEVVLACRCSVHLHMS